MSNRRKPKPTRKQPRRRPIERSPAEEEPVTYVWINSELMPDGSYAPSLAFTDDRAVALTEDTATQYALAVLDAAHRADYDAAVLRQMTATSLDRDAAATFVAADLRPARGPQRETGTPLSLVPGVSHRTGEPFLTVHLDGEPLGQWTFNDARLHALAMLEAVIGATHDTAYHRTLTQTIGLDDQHARAAIADIARYREEPAT